MPAHQTTSFFRNTVQTLKMLARPRRQPAEAAGLWHVWGGRRSWLLALGLLTLATAQAQTAVSGAVAVNTRWTLANAPYVVNSDLVVQNGAVLTIDAGVTVYMAANTSLTVQSGGIKAQGSALQPVRVLSEKTRLGQAAAPGDWKQWVFNPGASNTQLDYVTFEHGRGLVIKGSAPVLNNLSINNQLGAAITLDLAASPTGVGNKAAGNSLNGIVVPAGDISGNVKWGISGIPYVVSSGVVSVGASPTIASVTPSAVQQGDTVTLNVTGSRLTGLVGARFDTPGLRAEVLPGATDAQASLSVTADAAASIGATSMRLLTAAGEALFVGGFSVVQSQPALNSLAPATIYVGQGTVDVLFNGRNFTPQSVAIVGGSAVSTQYVSPTQVRASIAAPAAAGNLSVGLRTPDPVNAGQYLNSNTLFLPVAPAQLVIAPSSLSIIKGAVRNFTVTLPYPAPVGGLTVNLVSSVPTVATLPATVNIAEGQSTATFQVTAADLGSTVLTASKVGFVSGQAQVTVVPPPTLTLSPASLTLGVGRTAELVVQSSVPAGAGGLAVTLANSNSAAATVPASVVIPAGASSASVTLTTVAVGTATIVAQATDFVSASTTLTVRPVSLNLPAAALVAPGLTRSIPLTLSDPAPAGGLVVNLASSNAAVASAPASITVPAGQSSGNFVLSGVAAGSASIVATASGYQSATLPVSVEAVTIGIGSPAVGSITMPVDISLPYALTLSRPAPAGGVVIALSVADNAKAAVSPASITIPEGQTSGGVNLFSVTGVAKGSTTLSASAAGLNAASVPVTVTGKPELLFSRPALTVGKGLKTYTYEVYVYRRTDGNDYAPNQPQTVSLSSSDPTKASVPASVTIPANSYYTYFYVTGVDLTNGTPVSIDASATGYTAPSTKLAVSVVAPVFNFSNLDINRSPSSARDDFTIYVTTPGAYYSGNQTAAADMPISLSLLGATPAGIVDGFYNAQTGGTPVTQVVLRANNTYSDTVYVGTPTVAGSYKVQASVPAVATSSSAQVNVNAPELRFSTTAVTVGKGLKTYLYEVYVYRAVNGQSFNGSEALAVSLSSSDPAKVSVPATVTIPANSYYTYFYVTGVDLTNGTPVTIDATATGYSAPTTKLAANVATPVFNFNALDVNRSASSARDDFSIYVTTPGAYYSGSQTAAVDMPISLSVVAANPAGIVDGFYSAQSGGSPVSQVVLRANNAYSDTAYVATPKEAGTYQVQASAAGITTGTSAAVSVKAPELRFSTTALTVGKGLKTYAYEVYVYRAVNGQSFNGTEALTVNLSSGDATRASVPATVTIPANSAYIHFYVTGVDLTNGTPVSIDATATGYTSPASKLAVNVVAPVFNFSSLDVNRSPASTRDNFNIYVTTPGAIYSGNQTAAADMPINLSLVGASPAGIVDGFYNAQSGGSPVTQVVLRANNTYSDTVYVATPSSAGSYQVQAAASGVATGTSALVNVSAPELRFSTANVTVGKGLNTYYYEVYVYRAVNGQSFNGTEAVTVNLACSSAAICKVPASVVIPAGAYYTYFLVEGTGVGSSTVTASAVGYNAVQDLGVSVVPPQLNFSGLSTTAVGRQSSFSVYMTTPGATYSGSQTAAAQISVNLTSSSPGVATVPSAVLIQAGRTYSDSTTLTGVAAGTTTLTASGASMSSVTSGAVTITP